MGPTPSWPYMQNVAVLIFFLLSGFVIAFTLDSKSKHSSYAFDDYLIDRFARIYSALIPALLVIAIVDVVAGQTRGTSTVRALLGNLLMLQDVAGPLRELNVPSFGTAGQLWTLAIEWHLYIFAGAIFFLRRSPTMILLALLASTVPIVYWWRIPRQDFGHGVSGLWLAGFITYYLVPRLVTLPAWFKASVAIAGFAAYVAFVPPQQEYTRGTYPMLIIGFGALVALVSGMRARPDGSIARWVRFAAAYSFTLYLIHNSIVKALAKLWAGDPYLVFAVTLLIANVLSAAIAYYTEMRHRELARFLREGNVVARVRSLLRRDSPAVPTRLP